MELNIFLAFGLFAIVLLLGLTDVLQNPATYLDGRSFLIVLGGAFVALLISSKFQNFKTFLSGVKISC